MNRKRKVHFGETTIIAANGASVPEKKRRRYSKKSHSSSSQVGFLTHSSVATYQRRQKRLTATITSPISVRRALVSETESASNTTSSENEDEIDDAPFARYGAACCLTNLYIDSHDTINNFEEGLFKIKDIDERTVKYRWNIHNLTPNKLYSPVFYASGHPWRMLVYPRGNLAITSFSMYLDASEEESQKNGNEAIWPRFAKFTLSLVNQKDSKKTISFEAQKKFTAFELDWGFREFCPLRCLYDPDEGFVVNDVIVVECVLQICNSEEEMRAEIPNAILVYGGFGNLQAHQSNQLDVLHAYSIEKKKWVRLNCGSLTDSNVPKQLANHSMVSVGKNSVESILIFGGNDSSSVYYNVLYSLDVKSRTLSKEATTGQAPTSRSNHSAVVWYPENSSGDPHDEQEAKMVVFGGFNGIESCGDVYLFSVSSRKWERVIYSSQVKPKSRSCHSAIMKGSKMIIFGGYNGHQFFDDMWEFDCVGLKWTKLYEGNPSEVQQPVSECFLVEDDEEEVVLTEPSPAETSKAKNKLKAKSSNLSEQPPALRGHIALSLEEEDRMIVFGGQTPNLRSTNCMYEYNFGDSKWKKLALKGSAVKSRFSHCGVLAQVVSPLEALTPGQTITPSLQQRCLYVFGGEGEGEFLNDILEFDLSTDTFCRDISDNMLKKGIYHDVIFEVNGTQFKCHQCITNQSPFLREQIEKALGKSKSSVASQKAVVVQLDKTDVPSTQVFEFIVAFLYGASPNVNARLIIELFQTVQKLKIDPLLSLIINVFDEIIAADSVLDILEWTIKNENQNEKSIQAKCIKFICESNERYVALVQTKEFERLPKDLIMEIMRTKAKDYSSPRTSTVASEATASSPSFKSLHYLSLFQKEATLNLKNLIKHLRVSGENSDITLVSSDGKEFKVHKCIISSRAEYFQVLFASHFEESSQSHIKMETLNSKALGYILDFLYTGEIHISIERQSHTPEEELSDDSGSASSTPATTPIIGLNLIAAQPSSGSASTELQVTLTPPESRRTSISEVDLLSEHSNHSTGSVNSTTSTDDDFDDNEELMEALKEIAAAANMLMLKDLEESCYRRLEDEIRPHNALEMLDYCDHISNDHLMKQKCYEKLQEMSKHELVKIIDQLRTRPQTKAETTE